MIRVHRPLRKFKDHHEFNKVHGLSKSVQKHRKPIVLGIE